MLQLPLVAVYVHCSGTLLLHQLSLTKTGPDDQKDS